ncbi:MAG: hypothetical protein MUO40_11315 [Anaerolineaceae bacterium]|nr:hypothetical protein [Anaerolineaceae bacterium]
MKLNLTRIIVFSLLVILVLSSCAPKAQTVDVKALVIEKLEGEHTLEFVLSESRTAEEWDTVIENMINYGASINPEEKILIIDWLLEQQN